jgi:hypothetical protein
MSVQHCKRYSHEVTFVFSKKRNFIWPKVARTGGTSMLKGVLEKETPDILHKTTAQQKLFGQLSEEEFKSYYKFTFTRNPWDRAVSLYFIFKSEVGGSFDDFVHKTMSRLVSPMDKSSYGDLTRLDKNLHRHCLPQHLAFWDGQKNYVDFIGRFEHIEDDWGQVKKAIGLNGKVPHMSKTSHRDYRTYYDDNTKSIVEKIYQQDIELLGYKF